MEEKENIYRNRAVSTMKIGEQFNYETYHKLDEIYAELKLLSQLFANITTLFSLGLTYEERHIYAIKIATNDSNKIIVFECGIHAREWISPAICLYFIRHLVHERSWLLNQYQFVIVPTINPDGYEFTWTEDSWDTKHFCQHKSSNDSCNYDIACGKKPFSAQETKALSNYLTQISHKMIAYFAFHSYGQIWTYPYSYTDCQPNVSSGISNDWVYDKLGVRINFAVELRDLGQYHFLLPGWQIKPTAEEVWAGIEAIFAHLSQSEDMWFRSAAQTHIVQHFLISSCTFTQGDLARKKLMPTLFALYLKKLLPQNIHIIGYARSKKTVDDIRRSVDPYVALKDNEERTKYDQFWQINQYIAGNTDNTSDYMAVDSHLKKIESYYDVSHRLFYLALPPSVYAVTASALQSTLMSQTGWSRLVFEKPFGRDSQSSDQLSEALSKLFSEDQLYRIDHYLGKEMVQNIMAIRFSNTLFKYNWNNESISSVEILFKEPFGAQGRGGYFDQFGIIRDVVQNHLLQVLCLVAMDRPAANDANKIRDEKVKLLKQIEVLDVKDIVLGQYVGNPKGEGESALGYLDDPGVPADSTAATFSLVVLHINSDRWRGVPFFIRSGKALNESRVEVRVEFKGYDQSSDLFGGQSKPNRIVWRLQPNEAIYQRINIKRPGLGFALEETELDLTYSTRYHRAVLPDAYERLLMDVLDGSQVNFVRTDELSESWRIFTPSLHYIDEHRVQPFKYVFGSSGPPEADRLQAKYRLC
ncbi:unnamed protein product, partial [Medioppia subpectinata]